jgi:transposase-like protein
MAFEMVKAMQVEGLDWGEGYRPLGRQAIAAIIEGRMAEVVDGYLERLDLEETPDRRNGYYRRHLLTELGDIELHVPRTRRFSPCAVLRAYARRSAEIDRAILAGFVLGLSTRKVGEVLLTLLGRPVSPTTVSDVAKTLDAAVAAFHRRPLKNAYQALLLDGVVLARKTGVGAVRRPVLVALGLRPDGKKEIIDFWLAKSESAAEWERFLSDLHRRGLTGDGLDMICVDGGQGLLAALPTVLPGIPVQRCWAHKIRNVLDKVRAADRPAVKRALHAIMNAPHQPAAQKAARRFADRWEHRYPCAVACLRRDLDELLTCFRYKTPAARRGVRTTNAIERRFREVRRRTRPMGTFQDRTSMDRILFAVFTHENKLQGVSTPFLLTHNN